MLTIDSREAGMEAGRTVKNCWNDPHKRSWCLGPGE